MRRGEALLSYLMDHGRFGPPGLLGGRDGAPNEVVVGRQGGEYVSPHLSKDEDIRVVAGDTVTVRTPGGGGYGDPWQRDPMLVARDVARATAVLRTLVEHMILSHHGSYEVGSPKLPMTPEAIVRCCHLPLGSVKPPSLTTSVGLASNSLTTPMRAVWAPSESSAWSKPK